MKDYSAGVVDLSRVLARTYFERSESIVVTFSVTVTSCHQPHAYLLHPSVCPYDIHKI